LKANRVALLSDGSGEGKQGKRLLFVNKKKQKNFINAGLWAVVGDNAHNPA
jgi:hypothetical protein